MADVVRLHPRPRRGRAPARRAAHVPGRERRRALRPPGRAARRPGHARAGALPAGVRQRLPRPRRPLAHRRPGRSPSARLRRRPLLQAGAGRRVPPRGLARRGRRRRREAGAASVRRRTRPPWRPRAGGSPRSSATATCAYSRRDRPALRGRLRLLLPVVEGRLLPRRRQARGLPPPLRRARERGRAEQHLLPRAARGSVRPLGGAGARRLPLRRDGEPPADVVRARRGRGRVLPHGAADG